MLVSHFSAEEGLADTLEDESDEPKGHQDAEEGAGEAGRRLCNYTPILRRIEVADKDE